MCLLETTGINVDRPVFSYERRKWNWFDPSPSALEQLFSDVGFRDICVNKVTANGRLYGTGRRVRHVDIRRDGLSVPNIR